MVKLGVFFAVRTEAINIISTSFGFKQLTQHAKSSFITNDDFPIDWLCSYKEQEYYESWFIYFGLFNDAVCISDYTQWNGATNNKLERIK
jgi:hypothetical protein